MAEQPGSVLPYKQARCGGGKVIKLRAIAECLLWWAAERGLASQDHDSKAAAADPTAYFISQCDTKLWDDDFSDEGKAFAQTQYDDYLAEVSAYARSLGVADYDIPEDEVLTATAIRVFLAEARF